MLKRSFLVIILSNIAILLYARPMDCLSSSNQSQCINKYISQNSGWIIVPRGKYSLTEGINLASNIVLDGNQSVFEFKPKNNNDAVFVAKSANNVVIKNMTITGNGVFSKNPVCSGDKIYCGFSNKNMGIELIDSHQIIVQNIKISGFDIGVFITGTNSENLSGNIIITNNNISGMGQAGIRLTYVTNAKISDNNISNILGNQVSCEGNWTTHAKFADGIYMESIKSVWVLNNKISNVKRIGIAIDNRFTPAKVPVFINHDLIITGNIIKNVNDCRGTENNAGIWIEPLKIAKTGTSVVNAQINNNKIINTDALPCHNLQYGILSGADIANIYDNTITDFSGNGKKSIGIRCAYGNCIIKNNKITNTNVGMFFSDNAKNIEYKLTNNVIKTNLTNYVHTK